MLVLTRKTNESVVINGNIVVTVLSVDGEKVKIGISAPKEISILRHELHQAIEAQTELEKRLAEQAETPDAFAKLREVLLAHAAEEETETKHE